MEEAYCSFEVAKLLKEKGFNWPSSSTIIYSEEGYELRPGSGRHPDNLDSDEILCPTHQMAMKWLREVHNYIIEIAPSYQIPFDLSWSVIIYKFNGSGINCIDRQYDYDTYEEAVEHVLKYLLKNLLN